MNVRRCNCLKGCGIGISGEPAHQTAHPPVHPLNGRHTMIDHENVAASIPDTYNASTTFLAENLAAGRGEDTAILYEGQTYTYAQTLEMTN